MCLYRCAVFLFWTIVPAKHDPLHAFQNHISFPILMQMHLINSLISCILRFFINVKHEVLGLCFAKIISDSNIFHSILYHACCRNSLLLPVHDLNRSITYKKLHGFCSAIEPRVCIPMRCFYF